MMKIISVTVATSNFLRTINCLAKFRLRRDYHEERP